MRVADTHVLTLFFLGLLTQRRTQRTLRGPRFLDALEHGASIPNEVGCAACASRVGNKAPLEAADMWSYTSLTRAMIA